MALFHTKTCSKHDDYMTPKSAWLAIEKYIPKDKVIWEPFYGDGSSGKDLMLLKDDLRVVIHQPNCDFFKNDLGECCISNPPYSAKKEVFNRLKKLGKPFIMICPSSMLNTKYIRELFGDSEDRLKIIIPNKRIQFIKYKNGKKVENQKNRCNFDCFYYCWKIPNLKNDITWL
jgi:hypothetical protein